jgi:sigma-B regulation protein RsbU (phosphoserine phosphatase)
MKFRRYREMVVSLSHFIDTIYQNSDSYTSLDVQFADPANAGKLVIQPVLANEDVKWDDVKYEAGILANAAEHFEAVMVVNKDIISSIYFGVKDGFILSYDDRSHLKPLDSPIFNYFDTEWYKLVEESREICFTDVYEDLFGRGLVITCAGPIHDKDGNFCGVLGIDLLINDLYSEIMDVDFGDEASVLILGSKGDIISLDSHDTVSDFDQISNNRDFMSHRDKGIIAVANHYYAFDTIDTVNWKLCISIPQSRVMALAAAISDDINFSIIVFILIFMAILTIVVIMVWNFAAKITKPITDLAEDIDIMSGGDLSHRAEIRQGSTEIVDLAEKFNGMAASLKDHIDTITKVTADKERITAELSIAAKMQADNLPTNFPVRDELELYATMTPAREMGGDFYDFFMIDDDHIMLVMADVSGKGVPAAMFMIVAKALIKTRAGAPGTPAKMLFDINNTLCADNATGLFVTAWLGILTLSTGELIFSNAGHEYPALMRGGGGYELITGDNMPPLATVEDIEYFDETAILGRDDKLFLYTDGVPEAKASDGERFGIDRMTEVLNRCKERTPSELLDEMKREVDEFTGNETPFDDITMMSIVWHGK